MLSIERKERRVSGALGRLACELLYEAIFGIFDDLGVWVLVLGATLGIVS